MSKLYFRYGTMNCGKSLSLMQVAHNYEENNKKVLVIKSIIDTKGSDCLESRIGLKRKVNILLNNNETLDEYSLDNIDCILVDEAQFLSSKQVESLFKISKQNNIPVICYGLKTDFKGYLFTGSKRLLELADVLEELVTICSCGKKAKFNARYINNEFTLKGKEVVIDGCSTNIKYKPLCGECYLNSVLNIND